MAVCRAVFIGIVLVLLAIALGPTGWISLFAAYFSTPAKCLFSSTASSTAFIDSDHRYNTPLILFSIIFLTFSYLTRVIRIFGPSTEFAHERLRAIPGNRFKTLYERVAEKAEVESSSIARRMWTMVTVLLGIAYVLLKAAYEIHESMLWEIVWLVGALAWGTLRVVGLRVQANVPGEEVWGFGQMLPLLLSILPIWSICGSVYEINHRGSIQEQAPLSQTRKSSVETDLIVEISESSWFYRLITLMFGFVLVIIGDILYNYPSAPFNSINPWTTEALADPKYIPVMIAQYVILLSLCALILVVFTALCLGFAMEWISLPKYVLRCQLKGGYLSKQRRSIIRECLWASVLITLIMGVISFDWFLFNGPDAHFEYIFWNEG